MQPKFSNYQPGSRVSPKLDEIKPFNASKIQLKNLQIDTETPKPSSSSNFSQSTTHSRMQFTPNLAVPLTVKNMNQNLVASALNTQTPSNNNGTNPHHMNSPNHILGKNNPLPNHEPTKCSYKRNGIVKAYAANTNQGLVRNYNEDRVSIILNITNPNPTGRNRDDWPKCSFFGVYDGHGGVACADFLRDNLHQYVIKDENFPWKPVEAIRNGFQKAEKLFIENCLKLNEMNKIEANANIERSGSCCLVVLIVAEICYVANVGDSRAIISSHSGIKVDALSRDHKPLDEIENSRIKEAGGKIYQSQGIKSPSCGEIPSKTPQICLGPFRVFPGRLSVSRTFGDIEAKLEKFGGNPKVVIAEPDINVFKLFAEQEFIILASDGVYDKLTNKDIAKSVWDSLEDSNAVNIHQQCGLAVENILRSAINSRSLDNITVVMICFKGFKDKFKARQNKILKSIHLSKNEKVLNVNKNYNNVPVRDERILNLMKGGSFVAALDNSKNAVGNNENIFKRSLLEPNEYGAKYHRNSIDDKKLQEKESEFNLNRIITKFNELKLQQNERKDLFNGLGMMRKPEEERKNRASIVYK